MGEINVIKYNQRCSLLYITVYEANVYEYILLNHESEHEENQVVPRFAWHFMKPIILIWHYCSVRDHSDIWLHSVLLLLCTKLFTPISDKNAEAIVVCSQSPFIFPWVSNVQNWIEANGLISLIWITVKYLHDKQILYHTIQVRLHF